MFLPVAEFAPDRPSFLGAGTALTRNVLPRLPATFGPMPSLAAYSGALGARCQGALGVQDGAGNVALFAGDRTKLYRLSAGSTAWTDVSRAAPYTTASDQRWAAVPFGARVVMSNFADPIQSHVLGSGTGFTDLAAAAPRARHLAVVRDWLVAGNTYDPAGGAQPQRVWWSAIDDPTNWPAPGSLAAATVQSDYQDLVGEAGWVQGIVGNLGTADGAIFQERAIVRMAYVGPPAIFSFSPAEGARGTPAPGSIVQLGALAFYLGEDGFYAFDGSASQAIGAGRVDRFVLADLDAALVGRVSAAVDPASKTIFWAYPGAGNVAGRSNRLLAYNWSVDRWSLGEIDCQLLCRMLAPGFALDGLNAASASLDALPASLDARVWTSGRALLGAFDAGNRLGFFTGPALAATVDTVEIQPEPGQRALVTAARPLVDGGAPQVATMTRERTGDPPILSAASAPGPDGACPQRAAGRFVRARLTLPAGSAFDHVAGVEIATSPIGNR